MKPIKSEQHYTGLRFDIAGCQGSFYVSAFSIHTKDGALLWDWAFDLTKLSNIGQLEIALMPNLNQAILVSTGSDPQFVLNLNAHTLAELSGAIVNIVFRAHTLG